VTFAENSARLIVFHPDHAAEILASRDRWN
jgi:hypothetical protein